MKKWTRHLLLLENDDQIIIGNKHRCTYLKISRECYDILIDIVKKNINKKDFPKIFEKNDDANYFFELYELLIEKNILVDSDNSEFIEKIEVQWEITNQCNLYCKHCIANADVTKISDVDKKKVFDLADRILQLTPESLTITGGEPMMLPFFLEISQYLKHKCGGILNLMTNGTFITEENAKVISGIYDRVFISVDGVDEETCSVIRGKGVFRKVLFAVECLKKAGVKELSLSMVLTTDNKQYKKTFEDLCEKMEVVPLLRSFAAEGRGEKHKEWYISSEESKESEISRAQQDYICKIKSKQPILEFGACDGRYGSFEINQNGDVYLCAAMSNQEVLCNLMEFEGEIREFFYAEKYKNTQAYKNFEKKMPENSYRCKDCNVRYFCWHCPFINDQAVTNDKFFEQRCKYNKKDLAAAIWGEI
ncbi:radical SAM protein [Butyrivibrio sp. MC2013]|uniref:radical SAM protein n=1 Tax=Butyrivibrio sp. MC2013 TaxID=1280686 RepID=UPI0003F4BC19|nr:radical SAM protein [Butyrivibrio sp. MC2013]